MKRSRSCSSTQTLFFSARSSASKRRAWIVRRRDRERRVLLGADLDRIEATRGLWAEWAAAPRDGSLVDALHVAIVETLTARQRRVVEAYFFEGVSQGAIARQLGVTQQVVQKCL